MPLTLQGAYGQRTSHAAACWSPTLRCKLQWFSKTQCSACLAAVFILKLCLRLELLVLLILEDQQFQQPGVSHGSGCRKVGEIAAAKAASKSKGATALPVENSAPVDVHVPLWRLLRNAVWNVSPASVAAPALPQMLDGCGQAANGDRDAKAVPHESVHCSASSLSGHRSSQWAISLLRRWWLRKLF
jgi:hypothetical protein